MQAIERRPKRLCGCGMLLSDLFNDAVSIVFCGQEPRLTDPHGRGVVVAVFRLEEEAEMFVRKMNSLSKNDVRYWYILTDLIEKGQQL